MTASSVASAIPKIIEGSIEPIAGKEPSADVVITNSGYWIGG